MSARSKRKRHVQQSLFRRGGKRRGAGRKPKGRAPVYAMKQDRTSSPVIRCTS